MNDNQSVLDEPSTVEFYLPATFQFSREPGRIERFFARLIHQQGAMTEPAPTQSVLPGFYLPATARETIGGKRPRPKPP